MKSEPGAGGVFAPEARLELIEGEIVERVPIESPHAGAVNVLTRLFVRLARNLAIVSARDPLIVGERSVPQPDVALLGPRADSYSKVPSHGCRRNTAAHNEQMAEGGAFLPRPFSYRFPGRPM